MRETEIAVEATGRLESAAWAANDPEFVDAIARVCASTLELHPLVPPADTVGAAFDPLAWRAADDLDETWRTAFAFAEQFVVDVSGITDTDRGALGAAFGARTGEVVFLIYVADLVPRVRSVLAQLSGTPEAAAPASRLEPLESLWPAVDEFIRTVARMDSLDPVTSELVRLRGARQHRCRMCMSLRNRTAILAGADDALFAAVDTHASEDRFTPRHHAALELTDAMIWTPGHVAESTLDDVRSQLSTAEQVELVLDIMRNAANKIAVSLAADGANVDEGYEIYDIGSDGDPVYGLSLA